MTDATERKCIHQRGLSRVHGTKTRVSRYASLRSGLQVRGEHAQRLADCFGKFEHGERFLNKTNSALGEQRLRLAILTIPAHLIPVGLDGSELLFQIKGHTDILVAYCHQYVHCFSQGLVEIKRNGIIFAVSSKTQKLLSKIRRSSVRLFSPSISFWAVISVKLYSNAGAPSYVILRQPIKTPNSVPSFRSMTLSYMVSGSRARHWPIAPYSVVLHREQILYVQRQPFLRRNMCHEHVQRSRCKHRQSMAAVKR